LSAYLVLSSGLVGVAPETGVPDPLSYARSQLGVILHYLRLTVWPSPLCLDYAWPVVCPPWAILPGAMVVALLLAVTLRGLVRRQGYGFLGAWFFLILVPTTSVLPLAQLAFEHRMYLPLAAPAALTVAGAYAFWDRRLMRSAKAGSTAVMLHWAAPVAMLAAVLIALGYAAAVRNADYQSPLAIWQDTVHKRPHNSMAHYNLGVVFDRLDRVDEAIEHYQWALRLQPDYAEAHSNLATALVMSGDTREAIAHYEQAVRIQPDYAMAHNNFGNALASLGKSNEAIEQYHAALSLYPDYAHAHYNLAAFLARLGRTDEAIEHYREALRLQPDYVLAHTNLGIALAATGRTAEAIDHFEYAVQQEPRSASIHCQLALALTAAGKIREATKHYHKTLRLQPNTPVALNNLAWLLATHEPGGPGEAARAVELAQRARDLAGPENASCLDTLAAAYAAAGRFSDAILTAENALQLAQGTGQTPLAKNIVSRLEVYRAGRPYRRPEP
jgi:tetratricopeptide (TPR) repeat protein